MRSLMVLHPPCVSHPAVLELRWQIYAKEKKWDACVGISAGLVGSRPEQPGNWLNHAYALRRATSGGLVPAQNVLLEARQKFPHEWMIPYNLACYACQLGQLPGAQDWLEKALEAGDAKQVKLMALEDPDLEPLWAGDSLRFEPHSVINHHSFLYSVKASSPNARSYGFGIRPTR